MDTKKIAIIAGGWHYPIQFYREMEKQVLPEGWEMDLFCAGHRCPREAHDKDLSALGDTPREQYDKLLYEKIVDNKDLKNWNFRLYPNTIGDWGFSNQWLEEHDYKQYDLFLFTHDDNYILRNDFIKDVINTEGDWLIASNSLGMPSGWLRGSCEFFKREMLDKMGGKFDLSKTTLNREGLINTPDDLMALNDWNANSIPIMEFIAEHNIPVIYLSKYYRVSPYCLEGERGFIHKTHGINTPIEEDGFNNLIYKTL